MEKTTRQNRVKEALGKIYDQHPPYFREYLRRFKEDPTSRVFAPLAEAYRRLGRIDEAIEICLEGLEHHPDFHGGRVTLAKCYMDRRRFAPAREALERVVQFSPENLLAQRLLGDVYVGMGERERALHAYKMALLLSPGDMQLSQKIHAIEQGDMTFTPAEEEKNAEPLAPQDLVRDDSLAVSGAPVETAATSEVSSIDSLLGVKDDDEESFKTEHVSHVFAADGSGKTNQEITTETLGDLYYSQGQFDRALRIFEKLSEKGSTRELIRKVNLCRMKLGVEKDSVLRNRKIEMLRGLLGRVRSEKDPLDN